MNYINKTIMLALPAVCIANATVTLDKNYGNSDNYFKFDINEFKDGYELRWVSPLQRHFDDEQVKLVIPGSIDGKEVSIGAGAFSNLDADGLKIDLVFKQVDGKYVQMPQNCASLFYNAGSLRSIDFSGADIGAFINKMGGMFFGCQSLTKLDVSNFKTDNVEDMQSMFEGCVNLEEINLNYWSTGNVENMSGMLKDCRQLKALNLNHFDTANVKHMQKMFKGCENLTKLHIDSFNTERLDSLYQMFMGCRNLTTLNLNNFRTEHAISN